MDGPTITQDNALALAEKLRPALLRVSRRLRQEAQRLGASALDAMLLAHIKRTPGIGVSEMADLEHMSKPSMSGHVKRLEAAGWIVRVGDEQDGRRSGLTLTAEGVKQMAAIRQLRNDWLAARLNRLPPAQRQQLEDAIEPLLALMTVEP